MGERPVLDILHLVSLITAKLCYLLRSSWETSAQEPLSSAGDHGFLADSVWILIVPKGRSSLRILIIVNLVIPICAAIWDVLKDWFCNIKLWSGEFSAWCWLRKFSTGEWWQGKFTSTWDEAYTNSIALSYKIQLPFLNLQKSVGRRGLCHLSNQN